MQTTYYLLCKPVIFPRLSSYVFLDLLRDPPPNGMERSFISLVGFSHLSGLNLHSVTIILCAADFILTCLGWEIPLDPGVDYKTESTPSLRSAGNIL